MMTGEETKKLFVCLGTVLLAGGFVVVELGLRTLRSIFYCSSGRSV